MPTHSLNQPQQALASPPSTPPPMLQRLAPPPLVRQRAMQRVPVRRGRARSRRLAFSGRADLQRLEVALAELIAAELDDTPALSLPSAQPTPSREALPLPAQLDPPQSQVQNLWGQPVPNRAVSWYDPQVFDPRFEVKWPPKQRCKLPPKPKPAM